MATVSAMVLTFNEDDCISRCLEYLESLTNLTEINILDSGSTDKTLKICEEYKEKSKKLFVINKDHQFKNWAVDRNKHIGLCCGEWVLRIDADETFSQNLNGLLGELDRLWYDYGMECFVFDRMIMGHDNKHWLYCEHPQHCLYRRGRFKFKETHPFELLDVNNANVLNRMDGGQVRFVRFMPKYSGLVMKDHERLKTREKLIAKGERWKQLGVLDDPKFEAFGFPVTWWADRQEKEKDLPQHDLPKECWDVTTK